MLPPVFYSSRFTWENRDFPRFISLQLCFKTTLQRVRHKDVYRWEGAHLLFSDYLRVEGGILKTS